MYPGMYSKLNLLCFKIFVTNYLWQIPQLWQFRFSCNFSWFLLAEKLLNAAVLAIERSTIRMDPHVLIQISSNSEIFWTEMFFYISKKVSFLYFDKNTFQYLREKYVAWVSCDIFGERMHFIISLSGEYVTFRKCHWTQNIWTARRETEAEFRHDFSPWNKVSLRACRLSFVIVRMLSVYSALVQSLKSYLYRNLYHLHVEKKFWKFEK